MDRMKTFFKYVLMVVLFYVFSNVMTNAFLKVSFSEIKDYEINTEPLYVDVKEAEASNRNNSDSVVENKYLKFSMLSKNGNVLGEKYVRIDKIEVNQLKKYEVDFDYDNVKSFKIELVDSKPEEINFFELVKTNANDLINEVL